MILTLLIFLQQTMKTPDELRSSDLHYTALLPYRKLLPYLTYAVRVPCKICSNNSSESRVPSPVTLKHKRSRAVYCNLSVPSIPNLYLNAIRDRVSFNASSSVSYLALTYSTTNVPTIEAIDAILFSLTYPLCDYFSS